jgi:hypothetical protein
MSNWTNSRIENSLVKMMGKVSLGIATPATLHCIEIACKEVANRVENNSDCLMDGKRVSPTLAMIASKAKAVLA